MHFDAYSEKLHRIRQKTRRAFLLSILLHTVAIGLMSFSYIRWYRPMLLSESLVKDSIEVSSIRRFHTSSDRKRSMSSKRTVAASAAKISTNTAQQMNTQTSVTTDTSVYGIGTDALSPLSETQLNENISETPVWKPISVPKTQAPTITPISRNQETTSTASQEPTHYIADPVDRDGMMGEALEGIAESIADSQTDSIVDLVFLLDISGSMIDNIRAVGRQLTQMVSVFEEKGVDFRVGIVIFRYIEDDTIYHELTRNVELYKQLLTSHVVAAAGDERAHNAIVKAIRRVNFREDAKRRFILVTDEPSKGSYNLSDILVMCWENQIVIDVIGINHTTHRALSSKTGGLWFPIPIQQ
ncbi:VWA domain-containing protein [Candidatus Poribacteria bacterium]|nr:VWA domain-containing protein [Candidatus Poribacteria bacterium]